jgi:hypothetical protein
LKASFIFFVERIETMAENPSKQDFIDLEQDSDDEVQVNSKPSPVAGKIAGESLYPKKTKVKVESKNFYQMINIVPNVFDASNSVGMAGLILVASGSVIEFPFPQAVYKRNMEVLDHSHVIQHVFNFSIDGVVQPGHKTPYTKKALIWIAPAGKSFTQMNCNYLAEEYFQLCKVAGHIKEVQMPDLHPTESYTKDAFWSKFVDIKDFTIMFEKSEYKKNMRGVTSFLRSGINNLYSFAEPVNTPVEILIAARVGKDKYLHQDDKQRVKTYIATQQSINGAAGTPARGNTATQPIGKNPYGNEPPRKQPRLSKKDRISQKLEMVDHLLVAATMLRFRVIAKSMVILLRRTSVPGLYLKRPMTRVRKLRYVHTS